jgi:hypothetical protein
VPKVRAAFMLSAGVFPRGERMRVVVDQ